MAEYALIVALFGVGLWGIIGQRNLGKKVIGLSIINSAIVILFVYEASQGGETAPILIGARRPIADPVPQALMLTAIVIGVSLTALALGLVYRLYVRYGTLDVREIERAAREDDAAAHSEGGTHTKEPGGLRGDGRSPGTDDQEKGSGG